MGYYTRFDLKIFAFNPETQAKGLEVEKWTQEFHNIVELLKTRSGYTYLFNDEIKWYDFSKDMEYISKKFPDLLFELSGEGEESGDIWKAYYRGGNETMVKAKIVYDDPYGNS